MFVLIRSIHPRVESGMQPQSVPSRNIQRQSWKLPAESGIFEAFAERHVLAHLYGKTKNSGRRQRLCGL